MVLIDGHKEVLVMGSMEKLALREERRRTGRYMAAGVAIFLSLLGVYQAIIRGTPEYAALFAPALIMFVYILWILYASKHQQRLVKEANEALERAELDQQKEEEEAPPKVCKEKSVNIEKELEQKKHRYKLDRSYSIA